MLNYLVTSKARRRLLVLLWSEGADGSTRELASRADVAVASASVELRAMQRELLVVSRREGRTEVHSANLAHPDAKTLQALVATHVRSVHMPSDVDGSLKQQLRSMGAPLSGVAAVAVPPSAELETLTKGVALARRDPVVARSLPLCFWRLRDSLDARALAHHAGTPEQKHGVAFFLELTSQLGNDRRLAGLAETLRDGRMTSVREFFQPPSRMTDKAQCFPLALKWGFEMNMDLDSFRSVFRKFAVSV